MLSFKQFLEESLDNPYDIISHTSGKTRTGTYHTFHFKDHKDRNHTISITRRNKSDDAEVVFFDHKLGMHKSGNAGHHAIKIFSTVKHAMDKFSNHEDAKGLKNFRFDSSKELDKNAPGRKKQYKEGSRSKLYRKMAERAGGYSSENEKNITHIIPVNQGKK